MRCLVYNMTARLVNSQEDLGPVELPYSHPMHVLYTHDYFEITRWVLSGWEKSGRGGRVNAIVTLQLCILLPGVVLAWNPN